MDSGGVEMMAVLALLLLFALPDTHSECPSCQTISRAQIEASGAVYFADVVKLFDAFRFSSTSGFAWETFHGSGGPFGSSEVSVFIDGQYHEMNLFGEQDLNTLPVPLTRIESVTFQPMPQLIEGRFTGGGSLHVKTMQPPQGTHAAGAWHIGNETGDPGPFRYTDLATQNVDKFGPDSELSATFGGEPFSASAGARLTRFYATDPAVLPRTRAVADPGPLNQRLASVWVTGSTPFANGRVDAQAHGLYNSDFWFFEPAGRELPVRRTEGAVQLRGIRSLGNSRLGPAEVVYRGSASRQILNDEDSILPDFSPGWRRDQLSGSLEIQIGAPEHRWVLGGTAEYLTASEASDWSSSTSFGRLYVSRERHSQEGVSQKSDVAVSISDSGARLQFAQQLRHEIKGHNLALSIAVVGQLPEERPTYAFWAGKGFRGLRLPNVAYEISTPAATTEALGQFSWMRRLGDQFSVNVSVAGRSFRGLHIERPAFTLASDASFLTGAMEYSSQARGESVEVLGSLAGSAGIVQGRAFYSFMADVGGSSGFRSAWERVSRHRGGLSLEARPDPGFSVFASITALSSTNWPGYSGIDGVSSPQGYVYQSRIPARVLLDVAASKHLWNGRFRVSLQLRNLLNTVQCYHPVGAALDFSVFGRVEARF